MVMRMETSPLPSPDALPAKGTAHAGLLSVPSNTTSMTEGDYTELVAALSTAAGLLSTQRGERNAADLRIRSLVIMAGKEAKRSLLETRNRQRGVDTPNPTNLAP